MNQDFARRVFARLALPREGENAKIGEFTISFRNYYFVVGGKVPLNVAEELYENRIGRTDIRVAGHCGCPPPAKWTTTHKDGKEVLVDDENLRTFREKHPDLYAELIVKYEIVSDEEWETLPKFIDCYHIDSELGLLIFLQILNKHNLISWQI